MTDLLAVAESVLDGTVSVPGGHAPRAAAVLARQAFEELVDQQCLAVAPGLVGPSMRSKLIILSALVDPEGGERAQAAWAGLSQSCHHHSYELQPTAWEVRDLIALVRGLTPAVAATSSGASGSH